MKRYVSALLVAGMLTGVDLHAGTWKCIQPDGTVLFQDGGGAGCREMGALSDVQSIRSPSPQESVVSQPSFDSTDLLPAQAKRAGQMFSSRPFAKTSRTVPALSFHDLPPGAKAKGENIPNKGDIQLVQIDVNYAPAGDGPHVVTDHHFMNGSRQALGTAVLAAAKATQYDPGFLHVRLTMPMVGGSFHRGARVDGPSAGAVWAVAVTSAILGDPVRQDLCFSGTIDINLTVGPVGGLEDKIEGCHMLPQFQELMVPAGQRTFTLADKGMGRSLKVTEVSTLAEAYEIATGQPLRTAQ
ncbi:MAG: hypothetical protein OEY28_10050 [Nitrospira sp.]|nr:hypothetical protein [Nitrospira sp.]